MTKECRLLLEENNYNLNHDVINEMEYKINDDKYDSFCNKNVIYYFIGKDFFYH